MLGQIERGAAAPPPRPSRRASAAKAPTRRKPAPRAGRCGRRGAGAAAAAVGAQDRRRNRLDAGKVAGTGKDGRITKGDALAALEARAAQPTPAPAGGAAPPRAAVAADDAAREERVRMTRLRQTIARRLKEAQNTAAMLTTFNEVDMGAVMALRNQYKDVFEKRHGVKLGFMSFFVKACVAALKEVPAVNAEIDGTDLIYKNHYDIGVAVGTEQGLVVPVVRDADACRWPGSRRPSPSSASGPRRHADARRPAGRHLHHLQRRRLRLADVDADAQVRRPRGAWCRCSSRTWS